MGFSRSERQRIAYDFLYKHFIQSTIVYSLIYLVFVYFEITPYPLPDYAVEYLEFIGIDVSSVNVPLHLRFVIGFVVYIICTFYFVRWVFQI
jgi:hypothetical protein